MGNRSATLIAAAVCAALAGCGESESRGLSDLGEEQAVAREWSAALSNGNGDTICRLLSSRYFSRYSGETGSEPDAGDIAACEGALARLRPSGEADPRIKRTSFDGTDGKVTFSDRAPLHLVKEDGVWYVDEVPPGVCDTNYSACLKADVADYDCAGGSGNGPRFTGRVRVLRGDPYGLDSDSDGVGCE